MNSARQAVTALAALHIADEFTVFISRMYGSNNPGDWKVESD